MKKILIVDDSKFSRVANRKVLESLGYEVIGEACDGVEGIEKFNALSPDLIFTDLEMPNLNGIGMIKEIRSYNSEIKIVVISSIVNAQVMQEVSKMRASIVKKPVKKQILLNAIKLLDR